MKQRLTSLLMAFFIGAMLIAFAPVSPKVYTVSLSQEEWGSRLQTLQNIKLIMQKSTYPGNVISQWIDSVDVMAAEINKQVGQQLQDEAAQKELRRKQDSIMASKPKNK